MNPILEQKLRDLIDEAERQAAPAMCAVLDLLLGAHLNGKQNEFAKHCCQYSPIQTMGVTMEVSDKPEGFWPDLVPGECITGSDNYVN